MSWSTRITLLYVGFVAMILSLVIICAGEKVELESKDYYARELKFQGQIEATENAILLEVPISHTVSGREVTINIPKSLLTGNLKAEVLFFRPSDSSLDKNIQLSPDDEGNCTIDASRFSKGVYKMKISVNSNGKNYYEEEVINFN
jgi:hypothetical protein